MSPLPDQRNRNEVNRFPITFAVFGMLVRLFQECEAGVCLLIRPVLAQLTPLPEIVTLIGTGRVHHATIELQIPINCNQPAQQKNRHPVAKDVFIRGLPRRHFRFCR